MAYLLHWLFGLGRIYTSLFTKLTKNRAQKIGSMRQ